MTTGDIEVVTDNITVVNDCDKNLPFQLHENNKVVNQYHSFYLQFIILLKANFSSRCIK